MQNQKILFAASEAYPLMKTGGLGDVAGSLPIALKALRQDVRLIMPAYRDVLARAGTLVMVNPGLAGFSAPVRLLEGKLPGSQVKLWLVDAPALFDRPGNPYLGPGGKDWPDNAQRFALFARAVAAVARDEAGLDWRPDIVHCNDWQCGLIPALLSLDEQRPATVFTIHNLAYQGLFPPATFAELGLPPALWSPDGLEFYGRLSFIKGGLMYADMLSTVSPSYAQEIRTPEYGCGLEGLLNHRADRLTGILNGVDYREWDPRRDPLIAEPYTARDLSGKAANKAALQTRLGLPLEPQVPLIGLVSRLVEQKGMDLVVGILPALLAQPVQVAMLGSGEKRFETVFSDAMATHPRQFAVQIGFDESLAHLIESGADMFLMPSRFEPCGLNQIYSLRYGTVPIVRRTGGLADTVVDAAPDSLADGAATGITFEDATPQSLLAALQRAMALYRQPALWQQMIRAGMRQNFSWQRSAKEYLALYQRARYAQEAEDQSRRRGAV
ncbi:MAG: glycogen synthase GlgA [Gammaproteobacteria bacterium]|nr:glycogen synthase GlgA [Gammaproteobacteria bacterium]